MGCPLPRCLGRERSTPQGDLAVPIAVSCEEINWWATKCWLDSVTAESWDGDLVSEFGGMCPDCDRLLNCVLVSIPSICELVSHC